MNKKKKETRPEETVQDVAEENSSVNEEAQQETVTFTKEEFEQAREEVAKLQKEKEEAIALLQRNQADFDNFRRRNASAVADSFANGKRDCIEKLLPVLDNFDRAMADPGTEPEAWRQGIVMVQRQLMDELKKLGLSEVEADGKFDPNLHNAVMQEPADNVESGTITAVFMKGYRVDDKIIRHSMVKVAE